jgi:hypothetical protein
MRGEHDLLTSSVSLALEITNAPLTCSQIYCNEQVSARIAKATGVGTPCLVRASFDAAQAASD